MTLYNCVIKRKSDVIENCNDYSFAIVDEQEMENYNDIKHLAAFIIGNNIYNVCDSMDHGAAFNCLNEKYGLENATVIFLAKGNYWEIRNKISSIESLNTLKNFLLSIEPRFDENSSIMVYDINPNIKEKRYKKEDYKNLIDQVDYAIFRTIEEEKIVEEKENQIQQRKIHPFFRKIKRHICGK
jgi:hypothetical protein